MAGWREVTAEFAGMALLLLLVVSAIVAGFAPGSPLVDTVPNEDLRRLLTGVLTATAAAGIIYSPLGRISGGHLNPAVTTAFWVLGKMTSGSALKYSAAQVAGAITGALAALQVWDGAAASVRVGATVPRLGGAATALVAEAVMTFLLLTLILTFVDRPRLMPYTAAAASSLVAVLVFTEAPVSGTSLNPARSIGPALVGATWTGLWVYLVAPTLGALTAALLHRRLWGTVACAKLMHDQAYPCHFLNCAYTSPDDRIQRPVRTRSAAPSPIPRGIGRWRPGARHHRSRREHRR
ncbi:aquaporin [Nonomuraea sp. K274]|uniref:Aquaporin n=1 Tax=Nonomuraea cypriaca TaxID=1187855 RepID=A0A931A9Q4_9ACTN|nr:aquaporin [Nonomuraea cypriaca]MBF8188876.1 aquaporin [Nonomuraea cypriaca]